MGACAVLAASMRTPVSVGRPVVHTEGTGAQLGLPLALGTWRSLFGWTGGSSTGAWFKAMATSCFSSTHCKKVSPRQDLGTQRAAGPCNRPLLRACVVSNGHSVPEPCVGLASHPLARTRDTVPARTSTKMSSINDSVGALSVPGD